MLREERLQKIIAQIKEKKKVITTELMSHFNLSEGSIRRDLDELQERGILKKVHGGAVLLDEYTGNVKVETIDALDTSQIQRIQKALGLLDSKQIIFVDNSEVHRQLLTMLPEDLALTIYSNSLEILEVLNSKPMAEAFLIGGKFEFEKRKTGGYELLSQLEALNFHIAFINCKAVHPAYGLSTDNKDEAFVANKVIKSSRKNIVLCDPGMLMKSDLFSICRANEIDNLVLSKSTDPEIIELFDQVGIHIFLA